MGCKRTPVRSRPTVPFRPSSVAAARTWADASGSSFTPAPLERGPGPTKPGSKVRFLGWVPFLCRLTGRTSGSEPESAGSNPAGGTSFTEYETGVVPVPAWKAVRASRHDVQLVRAPPSWVNRWCGALSYKQTSAGSIPAPKTSFKEGEPGWSREPVRTRWAPHRAGVQLVLLPPCSGVPRVRVRCSGTANSPTRGPGISARGRMAQAPVFQTGYVGSIPTVQTSSTPPSVGRALPWYGCGAGSTPAGGSSSNAGSCPGPRRTRNAPSQVQLLKSAPVSAAGPPRRTCASPVGSLPTRVGGVEIPWGRTLLLPREARHLFKPRFAGSGAPSAKRGTLVRLQRGAPFLGR